MNGWNTHVDETGEEVGDEEVHEAVTIGRVQQTQSRNSRFRV